MYEIFLMHIHLARHSVRTQLAKSKGRRNFPEQSDNIHVLDEALGVGVILGPEVHELAEVVRPEDGPVAGEVVEVVHDDGDEEVEHKEGAHHEEADEEGVGHVGATTLRLAGVVRFGVTNGALAGKVQIVNQINRKKKILLTQECSRA